MTPLELLRKVRTSDITDALDSMGLQATLRDGYGYAPTLGCFS